ncbi:SusC/RagA family TonB-linked outer membrane protein [Algibacter pectinivorans]|uniref:TonB-linked outer membrane protein, SusC/RagA family n=1 Tax=Algibacter pectinivorans TaxID=870482 RepID=A0A1I1QYG4_9FLAO|nr:SusC/RagA family TonB-linked outer membrane protein [Algibacter pectinivorans]SFD27164.1 TonB-linked outer membrane protein, SusC/RagA family [Algibacter pectinivorans]
MKQKIKRHGAGSGIVLMLAILFSSFSAISLEAQERITGTVAGADGLPLPGVNVLQKGTRKGAVTDFDGNYSIQLVSGQKTLVFSYLGFQTQEVEVSNKATVNVTLEEDVAGLDEIVIIGFQAVKREKILGAVETIKSEEIQKAAPVDPLQGIQGKLSGVQVVSNNGPGEGFDIKIRGLSTLSAGATGPLYVVDGQQTFNIDNIDPNDIESLEVLKDGATAAIYGSQAGNGVVIIKTKTGKVGKLSLDITTVTGVNRLIGDLPAANAAQRIEQERLQNTTWGIGGGRDSLSLVSRNSFDVQRLVTRPALRHQTNVALSGGSEKAKFYWNTGFFNEEGLIINSEHKRVNTRLKVDVTPSDKFKLGTLVNLSYEYTNSISTGPVLGHLLNRVAYLPLFEPDGSFTPGSPNKFSLNPIQNAVLRKNDRRRYRGNVFNYAQFSITPELSIRSTLGVDFFLDRRDNFAPAILDPRNFENGIHRGDQRQTLTYQIQQDNTLNYLKSFGNHDVSAFAGMQIQRRKVDNFNYAAQFNNDLIQTWNNAVNDPGVDTETGLDNNTFFVDKEGGDRTQIVTTGIFSLFGGFNYDYANKYLFGATIRRDGSSSFGANNKYGYFPSATAGWRVSNENFLKNNSVIKNLLVRGSYGITGNDRIQPYRYVSTLGPSDIGGFIPLTLGNADIQWEESVSKNFGLELSLFKGRRLNIALDVWEKVTDGLLVESELPEESGFSSVLENRGVIKNNGVDFTIGGTIIKSTDFTWRSQFNISVLKNNVEELAVPIRTGRFITEEGRPVGNIWGYKNTGVYQYDESNAYTPEGERLFPNFDANGFFLGSYNRGNGDAYPADAEIRQLVHRSSRNVLRGGDYIWDDVNNDGFIDSEDEQVLGNGLPTVYGGFNHEFTYKNWTFDTSFDYSFGNEIYRRYDHDRNSLRAAVLSVSPDRLQNAWREQGDIAQWPTLQPGGARNQNRFDFSNSTANSSFVSDGSFIKWRYIRVGYTFPKDVLESFNIGMNRLSLNLAVNNIMTWTNYIGYNPEFGSRGNPLTPSEDSLRYPNDREFLLTLRAQF